MILIVNSRDNIAVALKDIPANTDLEAGGYRVFTHDAIPYGHKVALQDIGRGERVVKYGEVIGVATRDIKAGSHVHIHNMAGLRGRGDERA